MELHAQDNDNGVFANSRVDEAHVQQKRKRILYGKKHINTMNESLRRCYVAVYIHYENDSIMFN